MSKTTEEITIGLGWLDSILKFIKKYGILQILKAMMLLLIITMTIRACINPEFIFEHFRSWQQNYHNAELVDRNEKDAQIKALLDAWIYKYHANRVFLIQYHNGTKDWQHGTMRFEKCGTNVESIKNEYVNFNLTWLDMPYYLMRNDLFIGNMDELYITDPVLHDQLEEYDVDYIACILIRDDNGDPQGIFGVTWPMTDIDISTRTEKIHDYLIEDRVAIRDLTE